TDLLEDVEAIAAGPVGAGNDVDDVLLEDNATRHDVTKHEARDLLEHDVQVVAGSALASSASRSRTLATRPDHSTSATAKGWFNVWTGRSSSSASWRTSRTSSTARPTVSAP